MTASKRVSRFVTAILMSAFALGCESGEAEVSEPRAASAIAGGPATEGAGERVLVAEQRPGHLVYWMLPGPRTLDPAVFGRPGEPRMQVAPRLEAARRAVAAGRLQAGLPALLERVPWLVGVPMADRSRQQDRWAYAGAAPFGDRGRLVDGRFEARYHDRVGAASVGTGRGRGGDTAKFEATFTDPAGTGYRVLLEEVFRPPFPGWETAGGVVTHTRLHGASGTGSPLMPEVNALGALWGLAEVRVDGEVVASDQLIQVMTTQVVRWRREGWAQQADLPLAPAERHVPDQPHHTHLLVLPVAFQPGEGLVHAPVPTPYAGERGAQPFLHITFENDRIEWRPGVDDHATLAAQ